MATYTEKCYIQSVSETTLLAELTEEIEGEAVPVVNTLAYKTYGGTYVLIECAIGYNPRMHWQRYENANLSYAQKYEGEINFYFARRVQVSEFAWTDNDSEKIKLGQHVSNLTAAAMNSLYQKLIAMNDLIEMDDSIIPTIKKGDTITADAISIAFARISSGLRHTDKDAYDTLGNFTADIRKGKPIRASTLMAMKAGVNKLIQAMRP